MSTARPFPSARTVAVGQSFGRSLTVTEAHVVLASGIFGDFAPLHVDEEYAKTTKWGTRLVHGTLVTGIMAGTLSHFFGPNAAGYLQEEMHFRAPTYIGDTVTSTWTIDDIAEKPRLEAAVVSLRGTATRSAGAELVVEGTARLLVRL